MGKNSDVRKETDHTQVDIESTEINPSMEDTTHNRMLPHKEDPHELNQQVRQTDSSFIQKDEPAALDQTITVTEITSTLEDTIDAIIVPEVISTSSEQRALAVIPRRLPPVVISKARKSGIASTVSRSSNRDIHRGTLFIVLAVIVLFFVAISGSYVVLGANANTENASAPITFPQLSTSTATVDITPYHSIVNNTYTIALVTSQPDIAQQVEGARIISSSQTQSLQVNATGKITQLPISSTGTLQFSRIRSKKPVILPAGTPFLDNNNVALVLNAPITLRARSPLITVSAHAIPAGLQGNVPALSINSTLCYPSCATGATFHLQNTAFSGGQAAQSYTLIQQSDINTAANQLENALAITTQAAIQSQIGSLEQQVGSISCAPSSLSSNQQAGAIASHVTVYVTESCHGEVYSIQAALNLATNLFNNDVTTLAGPGYAIVGSVTTQVVSLPELINTQGTLSLRVMASGTAFYQVTPIKKQALAQLIAGKSLAAAQALLFNQRGIAHATITISDNSADTLPNDASKIDVVVVK